LPGEDAGSPAAAQLRPVTGPPIGGGGAKPSGSTEAPGEPVSAAGIQYMNRLSDFLFVASRAANGNGAGDVLWVPGQNR